MRREKFFSHNQQITGNEAENHIHSPCIMLDFWQQTYTGRGLMVTEQQRRQLLESYKDEFVVALGIILKCATGLLVVIAIAMIGIALDFNNNAGAGMQARR